MSLFEGKWESVEPYSFDSTEIQEINAYMPEALEYFFSNLERYIERERHILKTPVDYDRFGLELEKISKNAEQLESQLDEAHLFSISYLQQELIDGNHEEAESFDLVTNGQPIGFEHFKNQLHIISKIGDSYLSGKGQPGAPRKIHETSFIVWVTLLWKKSFNGWPPLTEDSWFQDLINLLLPKMGLKTVSFKKIILPAIKAAKEQHTE